MQGRAVPPHKPRASIKAGIAFVPEDRRQQGLVTEGSVARNITGVIRSGLTRVGLLTTGAENAAAIPWAQRLEVKTGALDMHATTMSGGNQQKVVIAKWLATRPTLLIIDEPTRGIDVGTKAEVHRLLSELAGQGMAILMISSELPEVLGVADRVLVVREGEITADLDRVRGHPRDRDDRRHPARRDRAGRRMSTTELLVEPSRVSPVQRALLGALRSREAAIAGVLLLIIVATTIKSPSFVFSHDGWRDLLLSPSLLLLLAIGEMVVIVTRNVDLSVGSVLGLSAYATGRLFIGHPGIPIVAVFVIGLLFGAFLGCINGLLVTAFKVPSLVITLGTMYIYRGALVHWAGSKQIYAYNLPNSFQNLGTAQVLGIPVLTLIGFAVLAIVGYYLWTARGGRELYAIGSDPEAAELFGLPVRRRVFGAFVLCGALAGLAGVVQAARYSTATSATGQGLELQAVAAVVIGGVAIFGGSGSVYGAAIGAFLLVTINSALPILGIPEFWQNAVVGALILISISLDRVLAQRRAHRLIESRDE